MLRQLVFRFAELTEREDEVASINRDTIESDLKQTRELAKAVDALDALDALHNHACGCGFGCESGPGPGPLRVYSRQYV